MLRRALREDCALPPGSRLLVAASGGADSTALLVGLASVAAEFHLKVEAAHLHHRLRGGEADGDLEAVRALCARLGVPLTEARWNTRARMRRRGLSGQNGLRILRREFLLGAARTRGATAVATAHSADDQLETLLMRLARGAGLVGLAGIRPRSGRFVRPLLAAPRAWIEADLRAAGIPWREDSTNAAPRYVRSRIRHEVVPRLAEIAGGNAPALARRAAAAATDAAAAETWLRGRVRRALPGFCRIQPGAVDLDSRKVAPWPSALRRTVLREAWRRAAGSGTGLTARHLDALDRLIRTGRPGGKVTLPDQMLATRERGLVRIRRNGPHGTALAGGGPGGRRARDESLLRRSRGEGQTGALGRTGR